MQGTEAPKHNIKAKYSCLNWKFKADKGSFTHTKKLQMILLVTKEQPNSQASEETVKVL